MKIAVLILASIALSPTDALSQRLESRATTFAQAALERLPAVHGPTLPLGPDSATASAQERAFLIGAGVGAVAGAFFFSGMAGLSDRNADARDYFIGAAVGAALGGSLTLLAQHIGT